MKPRLNDGGHGPRQVSLVRPRKNLNPRTPRPLIPENRSYLNPYESTSWLNHGARPLCLEPSAHLVLQHVRWQGSITQELVMEPASIEPPTQNQRQFYSLKACSSTLPNHTTCLAYLAIDQGHSGQVSDIDGSILIQVKLRSIQRFTTACSKVKGKDAQVENLHPTIAIIVD